jgi:hypothetical protein
MTYAPGPFVGTEAVAQRRYTRRTLASRAQLIYRNVYLPAGEDLTAATRAEAAWLWSGRNATVAGLYDEVCTVRGIPVTTPARTAFDLGRRGELSAALMRLDALANATRLTADDVAPVVAAHRGARGIKALRTAVALMDGGAESPQETRTRLLLLEAGLRRPVTQIPVIDDYGRTFARIDMGWPDLNVGVEYDGAQHWTDPRQRSHDIDRYAALAARRWIVRVSAEMLRCRPWVIVERVVDALRAAGCSWLDECGVVSRSSGRSVA